ncbi:MAG: ribonuclease HI [Gaiellales bacterium]
MSDPVVELWVDGACSGNPGPGGWAAILRYRGEQRELAGGEADTTNNRMELRSVIEGLSALTRPVPVVIHTDSSYVEQAFTRGWIRGWQRNGWRTAGRQPVKNRDLWEQLIALTEIHQLSWRRVKGHAGVELNERCDQLACAARDVAAGLASAETGS